MARKDPKIEITYFSFWYVQTQRLARIESLLHKVPAQSITLRHLTRYAQMRKWQNTEAQLLGDLMRTCQSYGEERAWYGFPQDSDAYAECACTLLQYLIDEFSDRAGTTYLSTDAPISEIRATIAKNHASAHLNSYSSFYDRCDSYRVRNSTPSQPKRVLGDIIRCLHNPADRPLLGFAANDAEFLSMAIELLKTLLITYHEVVSTSRADV